MRGDVGFCPSTGLVLVKAVIDRKIVLPFSRHEIDRISANADVERNVLTLRGIAVLGEFVEQRLMYLLKGLGRVMGKGYEEIDIGPA